MTQARSAREIPQGGSNLDENAGSDLSENQQSPVWDPWAWLSPDSGQAHFVSRYFAPGAGIPEDSVTGSIHATLVPYWAARLGRDRLVAFQASARGGWLDCELTGNRVFLVGNAVTFMEGTISLPGHAA